MVRPGASDALSAHEVAEAHKARQARSGLSRRYDNAAPARYATAGGPNQVLTASTSPGSVGSPTQHTCPSGRISTASGAAIAPTTGSSHGPTHLASIRRTRSAHGVM